MPSRHDKRDHGKSRKRGATPFYFAKWPFFMTWMARMGVQCAAECDGCEGDLAKYIFHDYLLIGVK